MDKNLYTIYDKKSELYAPPFVELTDGTAIRAISDMLQNPQAQFAKFPEDYTLVRVGSYDELTGTPSGDLPPITVMEITDIKDMKGN
jgi:hypothetical protein